MVDILKTHLKEIRFFLTNYEFNNLSDKKDI